MTDYSNMTRCEAVERCIGLERLLRNCRLELNDWMRSHGQDIETKEIIMAIDAALAQQGKGGVE